MRECWILLAAVVDTALATMAAGLVVGLAGGLTGSSAGYVPVGVIAGVVGALQMAPAMLAMPRWRRILVNLVGASAGALVAVTVHAVMRAAGMA